MEDASDKRSRSGKASSLKPLRQLLPYILEKRGLLAAAIISLLTASAATLTVPIALRRVIGKGFSGDQIETIDYYFMVMVGVILILAIASAARYYFVTKIGEGVVAGIRKDVFAAVLKFDAAYFDQARTGEVISRLTADTTQIKSAVGSTASVALRNILLFFGAVAMMAYTSWSLTSLVIFAIPLIVVPLVAFGRLVRRKSREAQDKLADASAYATEMVGSVRTIQSYTAERNIRARFDSVVDQAFNAASASIFARSLLTAILIFMVFSSVLGILWVGAHAIIAGDLPPEMLVQFLLYAVFAAGAMGSLSEVWGEVQQTAGATERLMELLAEEPKVTAPTTPSVLKNGEIAFRNVAFVYESTSGLPVLQDISFKIREGETVAIVGPSGAGKSTIFSLLTRFYDPQSGGIEIDGTNIKQADLETLRNLFAIVPQDPVIFNGTAGENIGFGVKANYSNDDIKKAAKAARALEFIEKMDGGLNARIGERGVTLSGGQKQRLAIARAILRDAPILLLDEATSALDAESEAHIQEALDDLMVGRTTIIIAHRLATILKADRILVIDEGRLVEEGTHNALIKQNGLYARLAKLQFDIATDMAAE